MVKLTKEDIRERKEVRNYDSNRVSQSKIKEILRKNNIRNPELDEATLKRIEKTNKENEEAKKLADVGLYEAETYNAPSFSDKVAGLFSEAKSRGSTAIYDIKRGYNNPGEIRKQQEQKEILEKLQLLREQKKWDKRKAEIIKYQNQNQKSSNYQKPQRKILPQQYQGQIQQQVQENNNQRYQHLALSNSNLSLNNAGLGLSNANMSLPKIGWDNNQEEPQRKERNFNYNMSLPVIGGLGGNPFENSAPRQQKKRQQRDLSYIGF